MVTEWRDFLSLLHIEYYPTLDKTFLIFGSKISSPRHRPTGHCGVRTTSSQVGGRWRPVSRHLGSCEKLPKYCKLSQIMSRDMENRSSWFKTHTHQHKHPWNSTFTNCDDNNISISQSSRSKDPAG